MSLKVLVIPEDPTQNGYILKPLVEKLLTDVGKPRARVEVLVSPRMRGYDHAVREIRSSLPASYGFYDLWLFFPDADRATSDAMARLEQSLASQKITLLCCAAEPEVEIYACVAYRSEMQNWTAARKHARFKEEVFGPLLAKHGDARRAGAGRDLMIAQSLKNVAVLFDCCPELKRLRDRILERVGGSSRP